MGIMKMFYKYKAMKAWLRSTRIGYRYIAFKDKMNDQKLNRELVGEDRMGNKYYQYYSPWGLPTRREIEFINKSSYELNDQAFYFWLNKRDEAPPTEEQIAQYYLEEEDRKQKGIEWDNKERLMMEQFYQQRFKIINKQEVNRRLGLEEDEQERILRLEQENRKIETIEDQLSNKINPVDSGQQLFEPEKWKPSPKQRKGEKRQP